MIGRFGEGKSGVYQELLRSDDFIRVTIGALFALVAWLLPKLTPTESWVVTFLLLISLAINALPIIYEAIKGLLQRELNVDELLALAIIGSILEGELLTAAVVCCIMILGGLIEEATAESARKAIESLVKLAPKYATVLREGQEVKVEVEELSQGDLLLIRPGEQVAVDAQIEEGFSSLDESIITGEAIPINKKIGDKILAGSINLSGLLQAKALAVGEDSTLGRIIELVQKAEKQRPQTLSSLEYFARWFTPLILSCALLTWLFTGSFERVVTVLIVGCPCALILAVPTAIVASVGCAARLGVMVKGGLHLEGLAQATTLFFDKTGTLTKGEPRVETIATVESITANEAISLAAMLEMGTNHPLARAILQEAEQRDLEVERVDNLAVRNGGVAAQVGERLLQLGNLESVGGREKIPPQLLTAVDEAEKLGITPLLLSSDGEILAFIGLADQARECAQATIAKLKQLNFKTIGILSGDYQPSVERLAQEVGIDSFWATLNPSEKLEMIKKKQAQGEKVIFVGDGINDAPALALADTAVAMGARGTESALETADIALMQDNIEQLPFLVQLARRMLTTIKVNIAFALFFNAIAVLVAANGIISPIAGAFVHNVGSVLVVLSSASLRFFKGS